MIGYKLLYSKKYGSYYSNASRSRTNELWAWVVLLMLIYVSDKHGVLNLIWSEQKKGIVSNKKYSYFMPEIKRKMFSDVRDLLRDHAH